MKFLERRLRVAQRDPVKIVPAQTAHSAIIVRFAPKVETAKRQRRKLGDRARRNQGDRDPLAAGILASDARDAR
jgi:hypothetical protein